MYLLMHTSYTATSVTLLFHSRGSFERGKVKPRVQAQASARVSLHKPSRKGGANTKHAHEEGDSAKSTAENLQRKIQILEEELDNAEKNLKETVEKFVFHLHFDFVSYFQPHGAADRVLCCVL